MQRPTGVTILAVLAAIGGVLGILAGIALVGLGGLAGAAGVSVGGAALVGGLVVLVLGVAELALAYGFWTLKPWAWKWGIVLAALQVVVAVLGVVGIVFSTSVPSALISIVISGVIIYYLSKPDIRAAFGAPATGWPFMGGG